ncbi:MULTISPECIES: metallochaperone AztD [Thalassospira]|nr:MULTISPECIES: metallochaperone AztD [Thalassospira]MDG4718553.1 metallochaperone AztD [Thalassospira sp. FZY0004]
MFKHMVQAAIISGAVLMPVLGVSVARADDETKQAWRLFVTDQEEGRVTVLDLEQKSVIDRFATTGYVTHLVPSQSGRTLAAVQMDHDVVHMIDSGIELSSHGDHSDLEIHDPALLPITIAGKRPVHAVPDHGAFYMFFDGEGAAKVFDEGDLIAGKPGHKTVTGSAPHHGVVVPKGNYHLISEPNLAVETKPGSLPPRLGLKVLDQDGKQVGPVHTCTGLHGEASSAGVTAFGCEEGVIIAYQNGDDAPTVEMLPYGKDMPEGRVGHLAGGKAMQFFLGDYGSDKLVFIDHAEQNPFHLINLPVRYVHFILDPARVTIAYVFTEDGYLHAVDLLDGKIVRSVQITKPYSKDGHWRDPRPRIAVAGDVISVTDPREHLVRLVDTETFAGNGEIPVDGLPFNIVAVGGSGLSH